jgi:adenine-specific DNA methylase
MKYIGNKTRLLGFIDDSLQKSGIPPKGVFADLFSGTTSVGEHYKKLGYTIISNDFMTYSYVLQKAYIESNEIPKFEELTKDLLERCKEPLQKALKDAKLTPKDIDEVIEVCKYPIPVLEPAATPEIDPNQEEHDV